VRNRGYLVFATDPSKGVDSAEYQQVYATEARTPNQAIAKVRPLAGGSPAAGVPEHGEVPGGGGGGTVSGVAGHQHPNFVASNRINGGPWLVRARGRAVRSSGRCPASVRTSGSRE
jgi:hypothetical protein